MNPGDALFPAWTVMFYATYRGTPFDLTYYRDPPQQKWVGGFRLVGYQLRASGASGILVFAASAIEKDTSWDRYFQPVTESPWSQIKVPPNTQSEYYGVEPSDFIGAISNHGHFRNAQIAPTDRSRFPHTCLSRGCGSPAYIGAVPAAAECSSPKCRYFRG